MSMGIEKKDGAIPRLLDEIVRPFRSLSVFPLGVTPAICSMTTCEEKAEFGLVKVLTNKKVEKRYSCPKCIASNFCILKENR